MEKVLVTGATGFLGGHTVRRLIREGARVTALGRNPSQGRALEQAGAKFINVDLGRATNLFDVVRDHDFVIHCAALSSPWGTYQSFFEANVTATKKLLEASKRAEVRRFVHVSTPTLYIDRGPRLNVREDEPLPRRAINFYAQTKRLAEDAVDDAAKNGFAVVTLRPQGIVGPGDTAIFPRMLRLAKKKLLPVIGNGDAWTDLTYVDNVVEALLLAMRAPAHVLGRKYNITNGEPVQIYDVTRKVLSELGLEVREKKISFAKAYAAAGVVEFVHRYLLRGREPALTRYSVCAMGLSRTLNIDAARRDLGYKPVLPWPQALNRLIEDLRADMRKGSAP